MRISLIWILTLVAPLGAGNTTESSFALRLGDRLFDPLTDQQRPAEPWGLASSGVDFQLVQLRGPIQQHWRAALEARGLEIVQYLHPYTYVVWGDASQLNQLDGAFVRWAGPFLPDYRVLPRFRADSAAPRSVRLLIYRRVPEELSLRRLRQLGAQQLRLAPIDARFNMVTCQLAPARYADVARLPGVYTLQEEALDGGDRGEMSCQVVANQIVGGTVQTGYQSWLNDAGVDGTGIILADVDSGVDQSHPDLIEAWITCSGTTCGGETSSTHGTHTAGIAVGRATSGTVNAQGFLRGQGLAPGAELIEQVYGATYTQPGGMLLLMSESIRNGAVLSTNSWGPTAIAKGYDMDTLQVDIGVRDADPQESGNQSLSYILAIANGSGGTSSQGTPDEAKNVFRVGSTWLADFGGLQLATLGSISDNSAHGPALDGRRLPDIVAPGKYVDSTTPANTYGLRGGTSMAAPAVAGSAALFYEYYRGLPQNPGQFDPSPALVRAALMAPGRDLAGGTDADGGTLGHRGTDNKQGWGRLDMQAVLASPVAYFDAPQVLDTTGQSWTETVSIVDHNKPAYVMLVYTDAPGHGLGGVQPAWNNNLDLEVDYGGQTYKGNVLGGSGWSTTGGSADGANNVEAVLLGPTTPSTPITLRVMATNLNSDGIPNQGNSTDQDFALVCYNCQQDPDYLMLVDQDNLTVCAGTAADFQVSLGQIGGFSMPVTLSTVGLPAELSAEFSNNPLTPPGVSTLTLTNTAALATGNYPFQIHASGNGIERDLDLVLRVEQTVPAAITLSAPLNGAPDQTVTPLFRWQSLEGATLYRFELATDNAFANTVHTHEQSGTEYSLPLTLTYSTTYYWRVRTSNPCGAGAWSTLFSFTIVAPPPVLLVDDDNNLPDVRSAYTQALAFLGVDYDVWDVATIQSEPTFSILAQYPVVLWFSGDAQTTGVPLAGPNVDGEAALTQYLDSGGNLILSSQYYLFDRGGNAPFTPTTFMTNRLGLASATLNTIFETVQGQGTFSGLGPYDLSPVYTLRADVVVPDGSTAAPFKYTANNSGAGLFRDNGTYTSIFLPWPLDGLNQNAMLDVTERLLTVCGVALDVCRNEVDFDGKLPLWPNQQSVLSLTDCLNSFLVP